MLSFIKRNLPLVSVVLLALALRLWGDYFGLPKYFFHPDEPYAIMKAKLFFNPELRPVDGVTIFHLFLYLYQRFLALFIGGDKEAVSDYIFGGRLISGLLSTGSVILTYLLAKRLFRTKFALIPALILATTFVDVQVAHYLRQDPYIQFFGLLFMLMYLKRNKWLLIYCFLIGAVSSLRFTAFIYLIPLFIVYLKETKIGAPKKLLYILFALLVSSIGFAFGHPAAFLVEHDPIGYVKLYYNFITKNSFSQAGIDSSNGVTSGYWWTKYLITTGLFYPTFTYFVIGLTTWPTSIVRRFRKADPLEVGIILATLLYFIALFVKGVRFDRYIIPITPFIVIIAAYPIVKISDFLKKKSLIARQITVIILCVITIVPNLIRVIIFDFLINQKDTRELAVDWIVENYGRDEPIVAVGSAIQMGNELYYGRKYSQISNLFPLEDRDALSKQSGNIIVFDTWTLHEVKNYHNVDRYRDFYNNYLLIKEKGTLIKKFSQPLFATEFFSPFELESSASVNDYHNPSVEIYKIPKID